MRAESFTYVLQQCRTWYGRVCCSHLPLLDCTPVLGAVGDKPLGIRVRYVFLDSAVLQELDPSCLPVGIKHTRYIPSVRALVCTMEVPGIH